MSIYFYFYEDELLYIGSTFDMKERIRTHKRDYEKDILPFYRDVKANGLTIDDLELEEVETEITDKIKLKILERKCQDLYDPLCNINRAYINEEEYREYHKEYNKSEKSKEYKKEYQKTEIYKEYQKTDKRKEYKKEYQKEYQKTNKFKQYKKEYNQLNRDKRNEYQRQYRARKKAEEQAKEI